MGEILHISDFDISFAQHFWAGGAFWPLSATAQSNFFLRITGKAET